MGIKRNIVRVIWGCCWLLAAAALVTLFVAAVNVRSLQRCQGSDIRIEGASNNNGFIDADDVMKMLDPDFRTNLKSRSIRSFDLQRIETELEKQVWVKNAELYFDNNRILRVRITEREPVARIFSSGGGSFYIDSAGTRLPLSPKRSVKLPVFTGFPDYGGNKGTPTWKAADRQLVNQIRDISMFLLENPFWMAQIAQVDITHARSFEMVPVVGNHVIEFGGGAHYAEKFHRLMIFYKQVLSKAGMDKYERIKLQFDKQVIGVKKQ